MHKNISEKKDSWEIESRPLSLLQVPSCSFILGLKDLAAGISDRANPVLARSSKPN